MSSPTQSQEVDPWPFEQLDQIARKGLDWNQDRPLEYHLRVARRYWDEGLKSKEAGDLTEAFVSLQRAAIMFVEKVPNHREYALRRTAAIKSSPSDIQRMVNKNRSISLKAHGDDSTSHLTINPRPKHPLPPIMADSRRESSQPIKIPSLFENSLLIAPMMAVSSLQIDTQNIEDSSYNPVIKISWAHEVITLVHITTSHTFSLQDPPVGVIVIGDPELRRIADLAISTVLEIAALNIQPTPRYVAEAVYLRAMFATTGAYPDYVRYDPVSAARDFEIATEGGYVAGWFRLGRHHERNHDPLPARSCFEWGLQLNARRCRYRLGIAYLFGQLGLQRDIVRGLQLLHQAANLAKVDMAGPAYLFALILLGELPDIPALSSDYLVAFVPSGSTVLLEVQKHMERAAFLGFAPAQYRLGLQYELGTPPFRSDPVLSVQYFRLASNHGVLEADVALSKWFFHGSEGLFNKDENLAFAFAFQAARKGLPVAELLMGFYCENGVGCARNADDARWWYKRAQANINSNVVATATERLFQLSDPSMPQQHTDIEDTFLASLFVSARPSPDPSHTFERTQRSNDINDLDADDGLVQTMEQNMTITYSGSAITNGQLEHLKGVTTRLTEIFNDVEKYKRLLRLRDLQAQLFLDTFQLFLDSGPSDAIFRRNLIVATQRLSRSTGLYPTCYNLKGIVLESDQPVAAGGFADIYKGKYIGQNVCLKAIRLYQKSEADSFLKQYSAEAVLWSQLSHPNLLPIYGLYRYHLRPCLVSPWMENGNLTKYLLEHPDVNRNLLVLDVVSGLAYLHDNDIIHGDLKGANILVDSFGRACLADFGLSAVSDSNILHWTSYSSAASKGGSSRWQAPELFDEEADDVVHNSKASDVYAVACVSYEVFTGNLPFFEHNRDTVIMLRVKAGTKPSRPPASSLSWGASGLTEATWSMMEAGWSTNPMNRPSIVDVTIYYQGIAPADHRRAPLPESMSSKRFRESPRNMPSITDIESLLDGIS